MAGVDAGARRPRVVVVETDSTLPQLGPGWAWIYFGGDARVYYSVRARVAGRAREIPAGPLINDVVRDHRDEILNFDAALEPRSELRWQATDLAERSVFTSSFVHACCCALGLDRVLQTTEDDLLVVVDDVLLGRRLRAVARTRRRDVDGPGVGRLTVVRVRLAVEGIAHRLLSLRRLARTRRAIRSRLDPARAAQPKLDVLLVTWADPETFPAGAPVERETYFGTLPGELRATGQNVGFLANLTTWVHSLDDILASLASASDPVVVPEEAVRLRDGVAIAVSTLVAPARLTGRFEPGGLDLSGLIVDELRRQWSKPRQLWALQFFHVGRFLADRVRPAKVIFPFENQPWEKTLRLGLRDALPETEVIGYQHAPISEGWFPYFPSRRDVERGNLPDRVHTIGPLWQRLFVASGYPHGQLDLTQALRYRHLADPAPSRIRAAGEPASVVVAGPIGRSDSLELLVKAVQALAPLSDVHVRVKLHPKLGVSERAFVRDVLDVLEIEELPPNVSFVGGHAYDVVRGADVVLYNTTSVSYEALAAGVPIVFVASDFWFDVDPIPATTGIRDVARTPEELRAAVECCFAEDATAYAARRERVRVLLADAFGA